jgi:hypothetical protein
MVYWKRNNCSANKVCIFGSLMQGLAKQSTHIMFTEAQVVSFGNYLFQRYKVRVFSNDGDNQPIIQRQVSHADVCNWKDKMKDSDQLYQGDPAWFRLWSADIIAQIHAIHSYEGTVKYDLILTGSNGETTRVYNVDSKYVVKRLPIPADSATITA